MSGGVGKAKRAREMYGLLLGVYDGTENTPLSLSFSFSFWEIEPLPLVFAQYVNQMNQLTVLKNDKVSTFSMQYVAKEIKTDHY